MIRFHSILFTFIWMLKLISASESDEFISNKYQSYLHLPRINFGGRFKANVATGNNPPSNFDDENFFNYDRYGLFEGGKNQWNPEGTNDFILRDCYVTSVCHIDSKCTEERSEDRMCGSVVTDSELSSFAKMVDIDTTFQIVPEIWGLKVRLPGFFEGEMKPTPLQSYWPRGVGVDDKGTGGLYQSILTNIQWAASANSSVVLKQMQERMLLLGSSELSIIFSLDSFRIYSSKDFAMGRILGTIGVSGPWAPQVNVWGRSLAPIYSLNFDNLDFKDTTKYLYTNYAPFVIDRQKGKLHISFLNSLLTLQSGNPMQFPNGTKLGYFSNTLEVGVIARPAGSCEESAVIITDISLINMTNIMIKLGGIIDIDLTEKQLEDLSHMPLSIFRNNGYECYLYMQEYKDGLLVRSFEKWVHRLENGEPIAHKLFVTRFGMPAQNIRISISPCNKNIEFVTGRGKKEPRPFTKVTNSTDENGLANFLLPTRSSNDYNRTGIDGNLEGYKYAIVNSSMTILNTHITDTMIAARVFHNHSYPVEVTWTDHILPIFQQYANLYPVMRNRGFDLSNYFDVVDHKEILRLSMSLPMTHPSYMPATRDLSRVKKGMILRWLSNDVPPYGDAKKLLRRHYLLDLLQTGLEVTHATIPSLFTSLWSIKKGYNKKARKILQQIINLEWQKSDLIARIMLSLGGRPKLFHRTFVLSYPSILPDGIDEDSQLFIEKLSEGLRDRIMAIKRPERSRLHLWFKKAIFSHTDANRRCYSKKKWRNLDCDSFWSFSRMQKARFKQKCRSAVNIMLKTSIQNLKPRQNYNPYEDPQERRIFKRHTSVDGFFNHILLVLSFITDCGSNNAIFHTTKSKKTFKSQHRTTYDYFSAVNDLRRIIMVTNSIDRKSQYNLLRSIVKDKCISTNFRLCNQIPRGKRTKFDDLGNNLRSRNNQLLHSPNGLPSYSIWPIIANPKTAMYPKGKARNIAEAFNDAYTFLLMSYEKMLNAATLESRNFYLETVNELNRAIHNLGLKLVQTPLRKYTNKHAGPNMTPTFEIDFRIARTKFLEKKHIIKKLNEVNWNIDRYIQIKSEYLKRQLPKLLGNQQNIVAEDEIEPRLTETIDVYQPLYKNPYVDIHAMYYDLPVT